MRSLDELERAWADRAPASSGAATGRGTVRLVCVRKGGGVHETPVRVALTAAGGLEGDRWAAGETPDPESQVTLMGADVVALLAAGEQPMHAAGDNFLVDLDLSDDALPAGARIRMGSALLEVTAKPHRGCNKFAARFGPDALRWVNLKQRRSERLRGLHCRVLEDGEVALGDAVRVLAPRPAE